MGEEKRLGCLAAVTAKKDKQTLSQHIYQQSVKPA